MPTWRPSRCSSICEGCCRPAAFVQAGSGCLSESTDSDHSDIFSLRTPAHFPAFHAMPPAVRHRKRGRPWIVVGDRKSTRLNSSHSQISYAVFCLKKKKKKNKILYIVLKYTT